MNESYVTLYNVIDTRTDLRHSVAIVKQSNVKWFVPVPVVEPTNADIQNNEIGG